MERSATVIYANTGTQQRKANGAAAASDENFGGIVWHVDVVATRLGAIEVFANEKDAPNYGTVISADVLSKTTKLRTDQAGIVTLIQGV